MSDFQAYADYDALGLAELIRSGQVRAREILETAIARAERDGRRLNAICCEAYEQALERCTDHPAGVFGGVPFLVKDLGGPLPGLKETEGCVFFEGSEALEAAEVIKRLIDAGVTVFGRTTSAELGLSFITHSPVYGSPTRNPWDPSRTSGGSSGGAAAAIAAGVVPMAHGNDGAGSIRVPAACCGLFGLKPTRARLPSGPQLGEGWAGVAYQGVITRSVRDTAAALQVMEGADLGAPHPAPAPQPFLEQIRKPPAPLRIAYMTRTFTGDTIHPECVAAVIRGAKLCESLGHRVTEATLSYDFEAALAATIDIVCTGTALAVQFRSAQLGRGPQEHELSPTAWAATSRGKQLTAMDYMKAVDTIHAQGRQIARFFLDYDILLTPTLALPPVAADRYPLTTPDIEKYWMGADGIFKFAPFTHIANVSGQPAASIPLHWTKEGLPVGTQIIARFGDETTLLQLAAQLEVAQPWFNRRPPQNVSP